MPSQALFGWRAKRLPPLLEIDQQCVATARIVPAPTLAEENLRAYVMLLSAHFQGFCRDLHSECIQALASAAPPAYAVMIQTLGVAGRELDGANPKFETIRSDFERLGFDLNAALALPDAATKLANERRVTHIGHLNSWRNYCAHHKNSQPKDGGPFTIPTVRTWRVSCDEFATQLDGIMYNYLSPMTGSPPW